MRRGVMFPNPKQLQNALEWWDAGQAKPQEWARLDEATRRGLTVTIIDAARILLDLFEECENCEGTGWIPDECGGRHIPDMSMSGCPACHVAGETGGRGYVLNRERMRATIGPVGRIAYRWGEDEPNGATGYELGREAAEIAQAAILAFLFGDSTETRQEGER